MTTDEGEGTAVRDMVMLLKRWGGEECEFNLTHRSHQFK
jgi:hypothetical protein